MIYHLDPLDPYGFSTSQPPEATDAPDADKPTEEDIARGCLTQVVASLATLVIGVALCLIASLFTGCSSTRETSSVDEHHIRDLMQRMDSLMHQKTVIQQDSAWRETILRQFQSIREKSDTSHKVVVDTAGNIIKETLIINNVREVTSEQERLEREVLLHRLDVMDSTMHLMQQQIHHSDSLLQSRQETTVKEVEKPLSWWQQAQLWLGRLVLIALAVLAAWWIMKKRSWWVGLLRKLI